MAKINRPNANVTAFASEALSGERTIFNSSFSSDVLDDNLNPSFRRGWGVFSQGEFPTLEDFNAFGYTSTQLISYLYQAGVPEWSPAQEYHRNSMATIGGSIYVSSQNNNVGNNPLEGNVPEFTNWQNIADTNADVESDSVIVFISDDNNPNPSFIKVNNDNSVNVFVTSELSSGEFVIFDEFTDNINMFLGGAIRATHVRDNIFCALTRTDIGFFEIDFDGFNINPVGNKLDLEFTTTSNYQIVTVRGDNLSPSSNDFIALWNGDANAIQLLSFDGTDFTNLGNVYEGLSGNIKLAKPNNDSQRIIAYNQNLSLLYTLSFDGTQFDLDGTTSTTGFDIGTINNIVSSTDNTIVAVNESEGLIRVLSAQTSSIFEVGEGFDTDLSNITSVASIGFSGYFMSSSDDNRIIWTQSQTDIPTGGTFWRPLSSRGFGFDGTGTALQSTNVQDAIIEVVDTMVYGVGQPFFSKNDPRNPNEILGFGQWVKIEGKFIAGASDTDQDFAGGTEGGDKTHRHNLSGQTSETQFNVTIPADGWGSIQQNGSLPEPSTQGRLVTGSGFAESNEDLESLAHADGSRTIQADPHSHSIGGTSGETSSLPPYEVFYMWVRVA